jgi:heat shock protein HslJ
MNAKLLMSATTLLAAGCAVDEGQRPETKPAPVASGPSLTVQLAGTSWEVVTLAGSPVAPGMGTKTPSITFVDETRASFTGGCNKFTSGYAYGWPEVISFDENAASTRMACSPELMKQDQNLATALKSSARIVNTSSGKAIVDASGVELLTLRAAPQP